tara:strand:- start:1331 stop:2197 length:867 start_codon:yes stop_codon:yes gene_type:complete
MTGFGRGDSTTDGWKVEVELSGVNRKQIDIAINLPNALLELESDVRKRISESISRGRIGVRVNLSQGGASESHLTYDAKLAGEYVEAAKSLSASTGIETRITAADLFRAPGLFRIEETLADPSDLRGPLFKAIDGALSQLISMQEQEGEHLRSDLLTRIDAIIEEADKIKELAPLVKDSFRKNLHSRLQESGLDIDLGDERLLREIGIFAEKSDITEELTRIDSHVSQFRTYIASDEPVGRPLDFLCQEFNRELNTIGSKANHAAIAQGVVNAKTELEKIREQVQNVQ